MFQQSVDIYRSQKSTIIGFNILRLLASIAVLLGHSFTLMGIKYPLSFSIETNAVYVFFIISGYFIYQSASSRSMVRYTIARFVRIMPGLLASVLFCLIIGIFYTNISIHKYITSPLTRQYVGNAILYINFYLEGVFLTNPYKGVINGSLWTLPIEVVSYLLVLALTTRRGPKTQICTLISVIITTHTGFELFVKNKSDYVIYATSIKYCLELNVFFLCGCLIRVINNNTEFLSFRTRYLVIWILLLYGLNKLMLYGPILTLVFGIIIVNIGNSKIFDKIIPMQINNHLRNNDYSYGMYLYAFPVQQIIIQYYPDNWIVYISTTIIITSIIAWISWTYIELPPLKWAKTLN